MPKSYRICTRCVMDTTDPDIAFDQDGVCSHCHRYDQAVRAYILPGEPGRKKLEEIVAEIKREGRGREYDCVIGLSGGVDSSFVVLKAQELGLRSLVVHLDNGWDSELAVKNVENIVKKLKLDLYSYVLDWEEFKDLQLSFLKASTPDSEIPTDHAIFSLLYQMTSKIGVKYYLGGDNVRTETHVPKAWSQGHLDWKYIKNIHLQFGRVKLKTFPYMNYWDVHRYNLTRKKILILNYLDYNKPEALKILEKKLDWRYYGGKHYESIYTRFYQGYILPRKFGYDKRRSHFSSLICSGQIPREQALKELESPPYPLDLQESDREYVIKKLGLTEAEFTQIMNQSPKSYWDYPSYLNGYSSIIYRLANRFFHYLNVILKNRS